MNATSPAVSPSPPSSSHAEAKAGAKRLTRVIRSVLAEDWPRSPDLIDALLTARPPLVPLLSSPSAAVATAAALALIAAVTHAKMLACRVVDALGTFVCSPRWNDTADQMSVEERVQLCCLLTRAGVLHPLSHVTTPQMFAFMLQCAAAASEPQLRAMIRAQVIPTLCRPLRLNAPAPSLLPVLSALTRFLAMGKSDAVAISSQVNRVANTVHQFRGLDALEALHQHEDVAVYQAAVACLQEYYVDEDDGADGSGVIFG